uniref:Putative secreted protein n=1 Tax=Ixodes ricinus TaxID=34613 RepID=A0A090XAW8_IXORI
MQLVFFSYLTYFYAVLLWFQVCEEHFLPSDFVRTTTYTDAKTGKVIEVPLQHVRIKPNAIPSVFPNCPSYLSRPQTSTREAPDEKRARQEAASLQKAIQLSKEAKEDDEKRTNISSFADLLQALPSFKTSGTWTIIKKESEVFFLDLTLQHAPAVRSSVTVSADLCVRVFFGETRINSLAGVTVPARLHDLRELSTVLQSVEQLRHDSSTDPSQEATRCLTLVSTLLEELSSEDQPHDWQEWQLEVLKFLKSQVDLVLSNATRYPPELLVFASLVFTISPHAYRFLRSSMKVKLPHPDTIRRLCSSYQMSPAKEQQDSCVSVICQVGL